MDERSAEVSRRKALRLLVGTAGGLSALTSVGCFKMMVGTGKMLFGDPKLPSEFTKLTRVDLSKGTQTVLVMCSTPESVDENVSTLRYDLIKGITRRLKLNGVKIINPDRIAEWLDANDGISVAEYSGTVTGITELARDFETDYIAWIDVQKFYLHEPNSAKLLRGHTSGYIRVFKVEEQAGQRSALKIYQTEFSLMYPQLQGISEEDRSLVVFQNDYLNNLCSHLSERFYDHRPGVRL